VCKVTKKIYSHINETEEKFDKISGVMPNIWQKEVNKKEDRLPDSDKKHMRDKC
jgi:hypothetical protein